MLAKDPQQRFQTPDEVAAALQPHCQPAPLAASAAKRAPAAPPKVDSLAPVLRGEGRGEGRNRLRRSRRSVGAWAAALALLLAFGIVGFFYGAAVYRFVTDQGPLVIETDDPDVEVVVKRGGQQVTIVDSKTGHKVNLKTGEYQLELNAGKQGLKLSTSEFGLTRGGREIAKVWLGKPDARPLAAQPKPAEPSAVLAKAPQPAPETLAQGAEAIEKKVEAAPQMADRRAADRSPDSESPAPPALDPRMSDYWLALIRKYDQDRDGRVGLNEASDKMREEWPTWDRKSSVASRAQKRWWMWLCRRTAVWRLRADRTRPFGCGRSPRARNYANSPGATATAYP